jgi:hypothetical protein
LQRLEDVIAGSHRNSAEFQELMNPFTVFGKNTTRDDEEVAVVVGGDPGGDEGAGTWRGFNKEGGAADTSDETVALGERPRGGAKVGVEFRKQTTATF